MSGMNANLIRNQVYIHQIIQQQMEAKLHGVDVTVLVDTSTFNMTIFVYLDGNTGKNPDYKDEISINDTTQRCSSNTRRVVAKMQQLILKHVNKRVHR